MQNQLPQVSPPTGQVRTGPPPVRCSCSPHPLHYLLQLLHPNPNLLIDASRCTTLLRRNDPPTSKCRGPIISYLGSLAPSPSLLRVILSNQLTQVIPHDRHRNASVNQASCRRLYVEKCSNTYYISTLHLPNPSPTPMDAVDDSSQCDGIRRHNWESLSSTRSSSRSHIQTDALMVFVYGIHGGIRDGAQRERVSHPPLNSRQVRTPWSN